jgi:hypothetical protein
MAENSPAHKPGEYIFQNDDSFFVYLVLIMNVGVQMPTRST